MKLFDIATVISIDKDNLLSIRGFTCKYQHIYPNQKFIKSIIVRDKIITNICKVNMNELYCKFKIKKCSINELLTWELFSCDKQTNENILQDFHEIFNKENKLISKVNNRNNHNHDHIIICKFGSGKLIINTSTFYKIDIMYKGTKVNETDYAICITIFYFVCDLLNKNLDPEQLILVFYHRL
jgi:hypothetical protein